jgi:hypothetical protein
VQPVVKAQLDAMDVQIELLRVQAQGLRQALTEPEKPPTARLEVPARCEGYPSDRCAEQDPDARKSLASFGNTNAWQCVGCRYRNTGTDGNKQE